MEQQQISSRRRRSPYQRNRKQQGIWLTYLLIGAIVFFLLLGLVTKDRDFSESENRKLARLPKFSLGAIADGSYFADWDAYIADQFPGRDFWISLNLGFSKLTGQKEANGVYLCKDNYLMEIPGDPALDKVDRNMGAINAFAAAHPNLNMYMTVVPNAVTVHSDKLPANAPVRDQRADLEYISTQLQGVQFLDVTKALLTHNEEELFYRTDHHWTSLGAYYAFQSMAESMGITAPELSEYTVYPVSTTFEGTLSSKSGSHNAKDKVEIYVSPTDIEYYVTYVDTQTSICSLYHREALEQKDHYTVFFGGNYSRVDITTTADTGRSLLLFKDSYANCFVQFLYPYFDHITMIDPRYYYDNVETIINSESITDVLYLYNANTFLADGSLMDVLMANG